MATTDQVTIDRTNLRAAANAGAAQVLSALVIALTVVAAAGGLFIPGLYREPATIALAMQGQDLVTLLAMPVFAFALYAAGRGSLRARLVWVGLLGYVCYTYTGAALAFYFNQLFLVYVALFSLSVFALVTAVGNIDVTQNGRNPL